VGFFDPALRIGDFVDWCARARDAGLKEEIVQRVLLRRRIHGSNLSASDPEKGAQAYLRLMRASLERKRSTRTGREA
jgi:hypothetical protein